MVSTSEDIESAVYSVTEAAAFKNPFISDFEANRVGDGQFAVEFSLRHTIPNKYLFEFCEDIFEMFQDASFLVNVMLHSVSDKSLQLRLVYTGKRRIGTNGPQSTQI